MIVYRDAELEVATARELARLRRAAADGDAADLLIRFGELEQGLVDALHPQVDDWGALEAELRGLAHRVASAYLSRAQGAPRAAPALRDVLRGLAALERRPLPPRLTIRPPEGYAHYALDPAAYAAAAAAYASDVTAARATTAVVVGVRSIGTGLSAVVAAAIGAERSLTVRPRGPTGSRRVVAGAALRRRLLGWAAAGGDILIVDEGPGATGETLAAVAAWLRGLGLAERRIVLFPSRASGMPLAPPDRRAWFAAARKYAPPHGDARPARVAGRLGLALADDLSAGRWRRLLPGAASAPACPEHERVEYRARDASGAAALVRFAGLGRWGTATLARALRLADAGVGAEPVGFAEGFLVLRWIDGEPLRRRAGRDPSFVAALGRYLAARTQRFRTGRASDRSPILALLETNAAEALGPAVPGLAAAIRRLASLPEREAVIPDGRMQAREWLRTSDGHAKVDALDHGLGLRLPGPVDPAWDVAAAAVEFRLGDRAVAGLVRACTAAGDDSAALAAAVVAYRAPYAALQLGDATLTARETGDPADRVRWRAECSRYRAALSAELRRAAERGGRAGVDTGAAVA